MIARPVLSRRRRHGRAEGDGVLDFGDGDVGFGELEEGVRRHGCSGLGRVEGGAAWCSEAGGSPAWGEGLRAERPGWRREGFGAELAGPEGCGGGSSSGSRSRGCGGCGGSVGDVSGVGGGGGFCRLRGYKRFVAGVLTLHIIRARGFVVGFLLLYYLYGVVEAVCGFREDGDGGVGLALGEAAASCYSRGRC